MRLSAVLSLLLAATSAFAQTPVANQPPVSDPQALTLAAQSIAAMTGGATIADATLTGTVNWIAGSDQESGAVTLMAKGVGESRIDLQLDRGTRSQIRNDIAGTFPQGINIRPDGTKVPLAMHNCWVNASWFFPALSFLNAASDPGLVFSYVGQETHRGIAVQHLQVVRYLSGRSDSFASLTQRSSAMDIYLDSASLLPRAFVFNTHPDDDALTDIRAEVLFSSYQSVSGVQVPFRIQRLIQNGLAVDLVLTSAVFNSGLSDSQFPIQ